MPAYLTTGCELACSFGAAPSVFVASSIAGKPVVFGTLEMATVAEIVPLVNVLPFGMCSSLANPEVSSATAAAAGVLTPMPCVPVIPTPWEPPSVDHVALEMPLATVQSRCVCAWGGEVSVTLAAQDFCTDAG